MTAHPTVRPGTAGSGRTPATRRDGRPGVVVTGCALVCAASMLVLGVWAMAAPHSFAGFIDYEPYNRHLVHDAGAFQVGIGVAVALALVWSDALSVTLAGFAVASALHAASHYADRHIGGHDGDVALLGVLTVVALGGLAVRIRGGRP